jgi:cytochrome b involved in lipid metabolism
MASDIRAPFDKHGQARKKIAVKPGFHLTDWMQLLRSTKPQQPRKISKAELAEHTSKYDCWTAYNGRVYDISRYMPYHPGGEKKLMLGAGKDCTELYNRYHSWINIDNMLGACLVGYLITEEPVILEGDDEDEGEEEEEKKSKEEDEEEKI